MRIASSGVVDPSKLSSEERQALCRELYEVQRQVFAGVDYDSFRKYVVESKADRTWILVHRNAESNVVGYLALHLFERTLQGQPVAIFRAEAGSLRAYRGGNANALFGFLRTLPYIVSHPLKKIYYLGSLVHPSSYSIFANQFVDIWPRAEVPTPPDLVTLMSTLAMEFGLLPVDPERPLVRQVGWTTQDTEVERDYWRRCESPAARFFIASNPGYGQGHGLMTIIPLSLGSLLAFGRRVVRQKAHRWVGALATRLHRLPLLWRLLRSSAASIRKLLQSTSMFACLPEAGLAALDSTAELLTLPAGSMVLREGEASEYMYVIVRGAVFVLSERAAGECIVDELGRGEVFGEVALLTNERRTASVRAATATSLLRIGRSALGLAMAAYPQLGTTLLNLCAQRLLMKTTKELERFKGMDRASWLAWFQQSTLAQLNSHESIAMHTGEHLFMVTGTAEVARSGVWMTAHAPAMIAANKSLRIRAQSRARVIHLPVGTTSYPPATKIAEEECG